MTETRSRRLIFISKIRQHPCLWDMESEHYRTLDIKEATWQGIVNELNWKEVPDVKTAKNEWKKLRDNHRDSIKRNKADTNYKWKYTENMAFLLPFMRTRKRKRLLRSPEIGDSPTPEERNAHKNYFDSDGDDGNASITNELNIENIKCEMYEDNEGNESGELNEEPNNPCGCTHKGKEEEVPKHPLDTFYQYLSDATKQFPPWLQNQVKRKMFAVLTEAEDSIEKIRSVSLT